MQENRALVDNVRTANIGRRFDGFIHNAWYVAAWSDEIRNDQPLARVICGQPIVFWRDSDGSPVGQFDRCPHRFAPLSMGKVSNGTLSCGYHGLEFNAEGRCIKSPHGPTPTAAKLQTYQLAEKYRAVWIWIGDATQADVGLIPSLPHFECVPDSAFTAGYVAADANYLLYLDNLIDLSHADYVHANTLGGGALSRAKGRIEEHEHSVIVRWEAKNEVPLPVRVDFGLFKASDRLDRWTEVAWFAPSVVALEDGGVLTGGDRKDSIVTRTCHFLTPETERSSHYFFGATRNFGIADSNLNQRMGNALLEIFTNEDKPMIAGQQARIGSADFWSLNPVLLRSDAGAVKMRRIIDRMLSE